ncbi:hypothetical protein BDV11DRAFT_188592 [Aspergillus similis]
MRARSVHYVHVRGPAPTQCLLLLPTRAQLHSVVCVVSRPSRSILSSLYFASYCTLIRALTKPTRPLLAYTYFSKHPFSGVVSTLLLQV